MSRLNIRKSELVKNQVGTKVPTISAERQLKRLTLSCMLWENQFYQDGVAHAELVKNLVPQVSPDVVNELSLAARTSYKLRHMPLLLQRELARNGKMSAKGLASVIKRPDEMSEFLAMYWSDKKQPLSNQVKKGLAQSFSSFNEYQLAKWDKNSAAISLRDVMFLTHPKPQNAEQEALFKRVAQNQLEIPDTWETQLSAGADKRETFTRLMQEKKLGALAFIRNLRNMASAGVDESLIRSYAATVNLEMVLPFRFIAAARQVPQFKDMLEQMMFRCLEKHPKLTGTTVLMVDVSGSMFGTNISAKSDLERFDAAAALAVMCREICESVKIYTFSDSACYVNTTKRGFALVEAIRTSQPHNGTQLGRSFAQVNVHAGVYDRVIVFTDEQSYDRPSYLITRSIGYLVNVASYKNGINHSNWVEVNGFSEAIIDYIQQYEAAEF